MTTPSFERRTDPDYNTFLRFATMKYATPDSVRSGPLREWAEHTHTHTHTQRDHHSLA